MPTAVMTESSENTMSIAAMVATARPRPSGGLGLVVGMAVSLALLGEQQHLARLEMPL